MKRVNFIGKTIFSLVILISNLLFAQSLAISQKKIEFSVVNGKNSETFLPRSYSMSFNKPVSLDNEVDKIYDHRRYLIALDFERIPSSLLKIITNYDKEFTGIIVITDSNNNSVQRKVTCVGATLDSLSDQQSPDYSSSYIYISCRELTIDNVLLK
ncbi:hypothetical protein OF897_21250 [Chryseobacterium formosus]|uniref:Uncharacterized protein n=1 Tax=Chryseobacterium formosus TaxID=1537363 RepID=A0ABT3XXT0_9FLAO|nr:hypothetical protein [Chryseobacterium formosus]MCX8526448.1 hypothetical protein [Chryseobacterium formosus]